MGMLSIVGPSIAKLDVKEPLDTRQNNITLNNSNKRKETNDGQTATKTNGLV